jgi:RND superfamily putative drug exporter
VAAGVPLWIGLSAVPILSGRRRSGGDSRFWGSLTGAVMKRPGLSLVLACGLLVALAIPALGMKSVTSDLDALPGDLAVIKTYNKVRRSSPLRA